jgi:uncharacterized membrane protein YfcA
VIAGVLLLVGGAAAGLFGSLLGLGGGVLIVPLLTLGFGRPLREAVAVSLVCVIVTSSAAAGAYLRSRTANLRLGMVLVLFTAVGALAGALVAFSLPDRVLAGLFALLLVYVALSMAKGLRSRATPAPDTRREPVPLGDGELIANGELVPVGDGEPADVGAPVGDRQPAPALPGVLGGALDGPGYRVRRLGPGGLASLGAGVVAALFGVGGGIVNVPTMHVMMGAPLRVAAATSNLMMGVTAVSSAIIYMLRGGLDPYLAAPTALGVFVGASVGARVAHRVDVRVIRGLFVVVLAWTAFQMARRAFGL